MLRIIAAEPVDRMPVSFWRHFYHKETSAEGLAEAMLGFQDRYDWDFMKVNPRASYHIEPWGARLSFSGQELVKPRVESLPVGSPDEWSRIERLNPITGAFGEILHALSMIADAASVKGRLHVVQTVFSPLSVAGDLVADEKVLLETIRHQPDVMHEVLRNITDTLKDFVAECFNAGATGIFFATTEWATPDMMSYEDYEQFGRPYDLELLEAAQEAEFNILHVCASNNYLAQLADYPGAIVNWDWNDPTNLPPDRFLKLSDRVLLGGIPQKDMLKDGNPEELTAKADQTAELLEGKRWILGPGCASSVETPYENFKALRDWAARTGIRY